MNCRTFSRRGCLALLLLGLFAVSGPRVGRDVALANEPGGMAAAEDETTRPRGHWPFFAFDNGVGRGEWTLDQQAELLAELGYDGIGYTGVRDIGAALEAFQARDLKMFSTYVRVSLKPGEPPYDPELPAAIRRFRGHGTALWLHVHSDQPVSEEEDRRAAELIGQIADLAAESQLPVVLYPHTGFYVATMADAVRLVKEIDRPHVGASFNLCHFLKQNDAATLADQLAAALPYLRLVSINGADAGNTQEMAWDRLIQTLDRGTFDLGDLLRVLHEAGYRGPIGLQCYAIPGDIRDNLQRSMRAWTALNRELSP
jgi:sugar phosphate isomerase/epimerase